MKALELQKSFALENLVFAERPKPEPGRGQVVVKIKAVSLNYRDLLTVRGQYDPRQPLPLIPCSDGAGEVVAVGEGVKNLRVGDSVATAFFQDWASGRPEAGKMRSTLGGPLDGTLCEYMALGECGVVRYPEHLSPVEAATLPCAALTAWNALVPKAKAGDWVLVQGTGGVALFALQFARMLGARVIVTSSSPEKLERAKQMGAECGVDYRAVPRWGKKVRELTGGAGVDLVVELGGAGTLEESLRACRPGAHVALIGVLSGVAREVNILPIIMQNLGIQGILVGNREQFEDMNRAIAAHRLKPVVHGTFPFERSQEAFSCLASGAHFGKVCIEMA